MNEETLPLHQVHTLRLILHVFVHDKAEVEVWEGAKTEAITKPFLNPLLFIGYGISVFSLERIEHGVAIFHPFATTKRLAAASNGLYADLEKWGFARVQLCHPLPASLAAMQLAVGTWGAEKFPDSNNFTRHTHLLREVEDLRRVLIEWFAIQAPRSPNVVWPSVVREFCGIFLLMCSIAHHRGFSLAECLTDEFQTVQARQYAEADSEGVVEHIREEESASE